MKHLHKVLFLCLFVFFSVFKLSAQKIEKSPVDMKEISDREKLRPPLEIEEGNKNAEEDEEKFHPIQILPAPEGSRVISQSTQNRGISSFNDEANNTSLTARPESMLAEFPGNK